MKHFRTRHLAAENYERVLALATREKWAASVQEPGAQLRLHVKPGLLAPTWGEMITIYFEGNDIAVNCICDPHVSRPSLTSWGRNEDHLSKIKDCLVVI
jgi:hypothetical protein